MLDLFKAIVLVDCLLGVGFWKVGLELFVGVGLVILVELKDWGKRIFLDLKFYDIFNMMLGVCLFVSWYEVDLFIFYVIVGS